jgi:sulfur-carrier protein adenylyltransferase/sulfurtransferase
MKSWHIRDIFNTPWKTINVVLVGAGGNGAPMLMRLWKIHKSLLALGRNGLDLTLVDHDTVSHSNIGRQPFYPGDVAHHKAVVLINRLKAVDPTVAHWKACKDAVTQKTRFTDVDFLISCVDNRLARRNMHLAIKTNRSSLPSYWLDMGNEANTGQIVFGQCYNEHARGRPPIVTEIYPDILDEKVPEDNTPSCSAAEALAKQDLFINESVVAQAASMLWQFLHKGHIDYSIVFLNNSQAQMTRVAIDNYALWKQMGHTTGRCKNIDIQ